MKNTIDKILIVFVFIVLCFDYDVKIKTFYDITKLFCCYFLFFLRRESTRRGSRKLNRHEDVRKGNLDDTGGKIKRHNIAD